MDLHRRQQLLLFDCQQVLFEVLTHVLHFLDTCTSLVMLHLSFDCRSEPFP